MDRSHGFASAMIDLWRSRRTAILRVSAHRVQTSISFLDGVPVWATGGAKSETLGRLCVRLGLITEEQYETAILKLADLDDQGAKARLGDVLIDLGFLDSTQLQNALRTQVREKIIACFQWEAIELEVEPDDGSIRRGNRSPWPVPALIAEGVVRHFEEPRCDAVIASELGRRVEMFDTKETVAALLNLPAELLAPFSGEQTLEQVCAGTPLNKQLAAAMLMLGFLDVMRTIDLAEQLRFPATMDLSFGESTDLVPEAGDEQDLMAMLQGEHERMKTSTPEAYFGIRAGATPKEVNIAFETRVRPFVQAALQGASAKEQARLTEVYNAIAALRDSLLEKSAPRVAGAPRKSSELDAEAAFLRGKQMLERGDRKAAADMFAKAIERSPDTREYRMFQAYTDMLRAQTDWDRDKAFAETRKYAKETLEQDAKNGKAHLLLGRLWRLEGKEERARQEFEKALEIANDKEAELELRVIERRLAKKAEKPKRGVFFWKKP